MNMISAMGLALGIDYSLFILSRYREERRRGLRRSTRLSPRERPPAGPSCSAGSPSCSRCSEWSSCPTRSCGASLWGDPRRHRLGVRGTDPVARRLEHARRPGERTADPGDRPKGDQQRWLRESVLVGRRWRRHAAPAREPGGWDGASACLRATRLAIDTGFSGSARCQTASPPSRATTHSIATSPASGTTRLKSSLRETSSSAPVQSAIEQLKASVAARTRSDRRRRQRRRAVTWSCSRSRRGRPGRTRGDGRNPPSARRSHSRCVRRSPDDRARRWIHCRGRRLLRHRRPLASDRLPLRPRPQLHPAHDRLPLDRHPRGRDRTQPALGRRGLRIARARLPERRRPRALRLPAGRHGRGLGAALPLLGALRPLDGLPGVPTEPDQGALHADRRHGAPSPSALARPRG